MTNSYYKRLQWVSGEVPDVAIQKLINSTIKDATDGPFRGLTFEGEFPKTGFGISNLRARDICQTNQGSGLFGNVASSTVWGITAVVSSTWTDWINLATDDRLYVIVTGIFNRSVTPQITRIRFKANGEDFPQIDMETMYNAQETIAYLEQPFAVRPGNNFTVRVLSPTTLAGTPSERIGLAGFALAKKAYLIQE